MPLSEQAKLSNIYTEWSTAVNGSYSVVDSARGVLTFVNVEYTKALIDLDDLIRQSIMCHLT